MDAGEPAARQRRKSPRDRQYWNVQPCRAQSRHRRRLTLPTHRMLGQLLNGPGRARSRSEVLPVYRARPPLQRPRAYRSRGLPDRQDDPAASDRRARPHGPKTADGGARDRWRRTLLGGRLGPQLGLAPGEPPDLQPRVGSSPRSRCLAGGVRRQWRTSLKVRRPALRTATGFGCGADMNGLRRRAGPDFGTRSATRSSPTTARSPSPASSGATEVQPQHRRGRQLRDVRRLAAGAPDRRAAGPDGHVPRRRGVPEDVGAGLRGPGDQLPAAERASRAPASGTLASVNLPVGAVPRRAAVVASGALVPLLRRGRRSLEHQIRLRERRPCGADREHRARRPRRRDRPRTAFRRLRGKAVRLAAGAAGDEARRLAQPLRLRVGGRVSFVAIASASQLCSRGLLASDLRAAGL